MEILTCEIYAIFTLIVTALWVWYGKNWSFETLAWAMFFPGMFAPWFAEESGFANKVIGTKKTQISIQCSVFGGLFAIGIITGVVVLDYVMGWGQIDEKAEVKGGSGSLVTGFIRAAGEEIGWRCFLLPCLLSHYATWKAFLISGIVWGLYHVLIMILLTHKLKTPHPKRTVFFQFLSCVISAVPHGWLAVKSGFSFWAPTMMHYTWNRINPVILGSIYTNTSAKVKGEQWMINGEGLAGCIVMAPIAALLLNNLG